MPFKLENKIKALKEDLWKWIREIFGHVVANEAEALDRIREWDYKSFRKCIFDLRGGSCFVYPLYTL